MADLKIYGIRHHGPGSTRAMLAALSTQRPDLILIEGPADAQQAIKDVPHEAMFPPVALLVYDPTDLKSAAFFPFAEFSPEWQAILFGDSQKTETRFIDLPRSLSAGLREEELFQKKEIGKRNFEKDPFAHLAELTGFPDHERWWEAMLEHAIPDGADIFDAIQNLMRAMRAEKTQPESEETIAREAHMRQSIRKGLADGFQKIAVVCGAWHGPVLEDFQKFKNVDDAALLKNLKKTKTTATWIPWTFDRLATRSGYGAGIQSPAWYQLLFENRAEASIRWLARAAHIFREKNLDASSAHLVDSVRLADAVSILRGLQIAGIDELRDAALAILGEGHQNWMQLIDNQLIIGEKIGQVPPTIAVVPLQRDFEEQIKNLRLSRYLKSTVEAAVLKLDLREEQDLRKSQFLHRLVLLCIDWGKLQSATGREQSTFNEVWKMSWQPEFSLRLIEAGIFGNTISDAAEKFCLQKIEDSEKVGLVDLIAVLDSGIKAALPNILPALLKAVREQAALTSDALILADSLLPLVQAMRYGQARRLDNSQFLVILENTIPRVCILMPLAAINLDESFANSVFKKIVAANRAIDLFDEKEFSALWEKALFDILSNQNSAALLRGFSLRLLFEKKKVVIEVAHLSMQTELSQISDAKTAGLWIEGFLSGSGLLLVHQPALFGLIDQWVQGQHQETFQETLPLLRRSFSAFSTSERQKLLSFSNRSRFSDPSKEKQFLIFALHKAIPVIGMLKNLLN